MYNPGSEGVALVKVGTVRDVLSTYTDFSVTDEYSAPATADAPLDKTVPRQAAGTGSVSPGQATATLAPPDISSPAFKAYRKAAEAGSEIEVEFWSGTYREVGESTSGANNTTVAITAASRIITLAQKGSGSTEIPDEFKADTITTDFWERGQHIVISGVAYHLGEYLTSTTRRISRIGAVSSDIVTPDDTALADVAATDAYTVIEYIFKITGRGRPTTGIDVSAAAAGLSCSIGIDLGPFATFEYAHKEWNG